MNSDSKEHLAELIEKQISGSINEAEHRELEEQLMKSKDARRLFLTLTSQHSHLQSLGDSLTVEELNNTRINLRNILAWTSAAAAIVALGFVLWTQSARPSPVATLHSSENAAWESSLPTVPGSELNPGIMSLKSGVATIKFGKGAKVTLEAPAKLELETQMRGRLHEGSAIIDVPESAIGFVMETADSYAVDHGTQFAISVDEEGRQSLFEVLSGEISVHHHSSEQELRLKDGEAVVADESGIEIWSPGPESGDLPDRTTELRFESEGREASSIRSNDTTYLHPHFLMAKRTALMEEFDRRSVFGFEMQNVDRSAIKFARIRLNHVPCGLGFRARLPSTSRFAIYGIPVANTPSYSGEIMQWQESPQPEQSQLLGHFELSRGDQFSSVLFETEALVEFLNNFPTEEVSFLLIRETDEQLGGLVHAFASSSHPTAMGPSLEVIY